MIDQQVSLTKLLAIALWALGAGTVTASVAVGFIVEPLSGLLVANAGLLVVGTALAVTVRGWFVRQMELTRNAFDLGRDVGREEGQVRRVR